MWSGIIGVVISRCPLLSFIFLIDVTFSIFPFSFFPKVFPSKLRSSNAVHKAAEELLLKKEEGTDEDFAVKEVQKEFAQSCTSLLSLESSCISLLTRPVASY